MASLTNQTDIYTKTEVDTLVAIAGAVTPALLATKADNTAFIATKAIVDSATTGVAALNTAVGNKANIATPSFTGLVSMSNNLNLVGRWHYGARVGPAGCRCESWCADHCWYSHGQPRY